MCIIQTSINVISVKDMLISVKFPVSGYVLTMLAEISKLWSKYSKRSLAKGALWTSH